MISASLYTRSTHNFSKLKISKRRQHIILEHRSIWSANHWSFLIPSPKSSATPIPILISTVEYFARWSIIVTKSPFHLLRPYQPSIGPGVPFSMSVSSSSLYIHLLAWVLHRRTCHINLFAVADQHGLRITEGGSVSSKIYAFGRWKLVAKRLYVIIAKVPKLNNKRYTTVETEALEGGEKGP